MLARRRLLLDAHISGPRLAGVLRERRHDIRAADEERDLGGWADQELLALAAAEERIMVTFDVKDFPDIVRSWAEAGRSHAGLAIVVGIDHGEFGAILGALQRLFEERRGRPPGAITPALSRGEAERRPVEIAGRRRFPDRAAVWQLPVKRERKPLDPILELDDQPILGVAAELVAVLENVAGRNPKHAGQFEAAKVEKMRGEVLARSGQPPT